MLSNTRIDKIGLQLRLDRIDASCLRELESFRQQFAPAYHYVEDIVVNGMRRKITGRPSKSTVAIIEKLKRETIRLSQMQDISGCRILVNDLASQDQLVQNLKIMLIDVEIDDKRITPTNGYRAIHVIARKYGRPIEIQVRTVLQHSWANLSEKIADEFGHSIKYGVGDKSAIRFLSRLSTATADLELVRHKKAVLAQRKVLQGRSRDVIRIAKRFSAEERSCLQDIKRIFSGK